MKNIIIFMLVNFFLFSKEKILIISSYHKEYQFQIEYINEIKNTVGDNYSYYNFYMNTKHIKEEKYSEMAEKAYDYYKDIRPDLVVLGDDNAFLLLKDKFEKEKIPIVFLGINNNLRNYFKMRPNNFTGVLERPLYQRNIAFIKDCISGLKKILIIYDDSNTSKYIIQEAFGGNAVSKVLGVEINIVNTNSFEKWQELILKESKNYDAVILGLYSTLRDKKDKIVSEDYVLEWSSKNVQRPFFGTWSFSVGKEKTIGGLVLSGKDQGEEAGEIIKRILENREKPASIFPVTALKGEYIISKSELLRWGISIPEKYKYLIKEYP